jgi:hypothetical protein
MLEIINHALLGYAGDAEGKRVAGLAALPI